MSQRSRNPAVLPHAPEVDRHQHRNPERQTDAVQDVEPQQRALADERPAEEREARIVGGNALLRFYVLHCVAFPLVAAFLMAVHFWRVRKDGGISGPL